MGDLRNKAKYFADQARMKRQMAEENARRAREARPQTCRCGHPWGEVEPMWRVSVSFTQPRGRLECPRCISAADRSLLIAGGYVDADVFAVGDGDPGARCTSFTGKEKWVGLTEPPRDK